MPNNVETKETAIVAGHREHPPLKKRVSHWLGDYKWLLIALIWAVTITLGYSGYTKYFQSTGESGAIWDAIYNTLKLFTLTFEKVPGTLNTELQIARFLAPAIGLCTAIQALAYFFHEQFQTFKIRFNRNHIVICGLGQKGQLITSKYRALGEQVVIIEKNPQNEWIQNCKERGAVILIGNAADPDLLRKAGAPKAGCIICVTGNDGTNAEIAVCVRELAPGISGKALSCLAHIVNLQLWSFLREYEMRMGKLDAFRLSFFNVYESGSRGLLYEFPPFADGDAQESSPHIMLVGIGRMGESLVLNAVRKWRFSNHPANGVMRITLIAREARSKEDSWCSRYPQIEQICKLTPVDIDTNSPAFEKGDFLFNQDGHCDLRMIYICLGDETDAVTATIKLRKRLGNLDIPIVVRTNDDAGLAALLRKNKSQKDNPGKVYTYPLLKETCTPDVIWGGCTSEILARAIHEDYIRNAIKRCETPQTNPSMVPWESLPGSLKESNRNQAEHISGKLESLGYDFTMTTDWDPPMVQFSADEVEKLSLMEHDRFVAERLRQGWRAGDIKDEKRKISPTLIPWDALSEEEKEKDRTTVRGIPEFLAKAGYQVIRLKPREDTAGDIKIS